MACSPNDSRKGFAFRNPDLESRGGWGSIITPDELRYVYCFGIPLVAANGQTIDDSQLQWYIENAIGSVETDLDVDFLIKRRRYRTINWVVPRTFDGPAWNGSEASVSGTRDLVAGADLTTKRYMKVSVDGGAYAVVDCAGGAPGVRTADQIAAAINAALGYAAASAVKTVPYQGRPARIVLKIKGQVKLDAGSLDLDATANECTDLILGIGDGRHSYTGWIADRDYLWEDPYDFDRKKFNEYIYLKLKRRPLAQLWGCEFRDIAGGKIADIIEWAKPNYLKGSIEFFPHTGALANLPLYAGASFPLAQAYQAITNYPDGFFVDYDSGFKSVLEMRARWPELFEIVGKLATINLLLDFGDGRFNNITSSSYGLAGVSESLSTTLSASTTLFSGRIKEYGEAIKEFYKENKRKYSGFLLGAL